MGTDSLDKAVERLSKTLRQMELPFIISGALAVNHHGHRRATEDVDILMRRDDLSKFKDKNISRGWLNQFEGSKDFIDTIHGIPIDVSLAGDFSGDGKPKPVSFPDPTDESLIAFQDDLPFMNLTKMIELKLACGMSACDRPRDFDDVIQLIRKNQLDRPFGSKLNPYVLETWNKYWDIAQIQSGEYSTTAQIQLKSPTHQKQK